MMAIEAGPVAAPVAAPRTRNAISDGAFQDSAMSAAKRPTHPIDHA
jgi:hypothetical protein